MRRYLKFGLSDLRETFSGRRDPLVPAQSSIFIGGGDYRSIGDEFFAIFRKLDLIRPDSRILDVGCGIGRMARPFTDYLSSEGSYDGFDIDARGIAWCQKRYRRRFSNFRFTAVDVYNAFYNPGGKIPPNAFVFPYADDTFDFIFLTSVFTHMLPDDVEHYLKEVHRVLKPGRACLITFFLSNPEADDLVAEGKGLTSFPESRGPYRVKDLEIPEDAVCYPQKAIEELYRNVGFSEPPTIYPGYWCGRPCLLTYQDAILAKKNA